MLAGYEWAIESHSRKDTYCHGPNPGSMTGNAGAVSKGHLTYAKPQNIYIKRIIYSKIRSIS
jgi:hypothetical protein